MSISLQSVNVADVKATSRPRLSLKEAYAKHGAVRITSSEKGNIVTLTLYGNHKFAAFSTPAAEITKEYRAQIEGIVADMVAKADEKTIAAYTAALHASQKSLRAKYQK